MGGSNSVLNVEGHVWKKRDSHEIYTNVYNRTLSLVSYEPNEYLSFGKLNLDYFKKNFKDEFLIEEKTLSFYDGKRKQYSNEIKENCCLNNDTHKFYNEGYKTCPIYVQNLNNNFCDDILYEACFEKNILNKNCTLWIRNVVQFKKEKYLNNIKKFVSKESNRNHKYTQIFLESLRDYADSINNYNFIADTILNSYSNKIKFDEYKCAFSPNYILDKEKENNSTPKECWYKECVLSPTYKLKTENLQKSKLCNINICDIKIDQLNLAANEVLIKCMNKYNNKKIENFKDTIPFKLDQDDLFYIPTFLNTILPFFIIFLFLFI